LSVREAASLIIEDAAKLAHSHSEIAGGLRVLAAAGFQRPRDEGTAKWPSSWKDERST
jgi:hypothetical protein